MTTDLATACVLCSHACGMRVDVEDNRIVRVRADGRNPITRGYSCHKGYTLQHYVEHAQRVQHPLRRARGANGSFERVGWDVAVQDIGQRLRAIHRQHGPRSIALIGIGGQANHLDAPAGLAFLGATGSPWWFNALAQEKTQHALVDHWMFRAPANATLLPDTEHADYVVLLGTNPVVSNRGRNATEVIAALRRDPTRTLVVVDPRRTETARSADLHLAVCPGGDAYLLLGLVACILQEKLFDRSFVDERTRGLGEVERAFAGLRVEDLAERAGLTAAEVLAVARGIARARRATMYMDLGLEQGLFSTLTAWLMRLVLCLTGHVGREGGLVFHGTFSPRLPVLDRKRHRAPVSGIEAIESAGPIGMFSPNLVPEEILREAPDRIRAVIVEGANPLVQYADSRRYAEAFARLDLLVVIDPAMSETARVADYALPTPVGYEKWEYSGFPKHYPGILAQLRPPVLRGPQEALPEAEIYARILRAMGLVEPTPRVLSRLARHGRSPARAAALLGTASALAAVRGGGGGRMAARILLWLQDALGPQLPAPALTGMWLLSHLFAMTRRDDIVRAHPDLARERNPFVLGEHLFDQLLAHPEGVELGRLSTTDNLGDHLTHRDGKVHLAPPQMIRELARALAWRPERDHELPFVLNGGKRTHWNANTIQRDPAWRRGKGPHCPLSMHPEDAARLGVEDGALVRLTTRRGALEVPVALDASVQPGHVTIPNGFGLDFPDATGQLQRHGARVNELTDSSDRDPFTGAPHLKYIRCGITAIPRRS